MGHMMPSSACGILPLAALKRRKRRSFRAATMRLQCFISNCSIAARWLGGRRSVEFPYWLFLEQWFMRMINRPCLLAPSTHLYRCFTVNTISGFIGLSSWSQDLAFSRSKILPGWFSEKAFNWVCNAFSPPPRCTVSPEEADVNRPVNR